MKILAYTISLYLFTTFGFAQVPKKDYRPSEISFGMDMLKVGKTLSTNRTEFEFQSKVDFNKYYLAADFGTLKMSPNGTDFNYQMSGNYFRIGPQVNFMSYSSSRSDLFFGLMYSRASLKDELDYLKSGNGWNDEQINLVNNKLNARWWEANLGLTVKVAGPIHFGWSMRFKFAKKLSGYQVLHPLEIPGFGEASKGNQFGFNYYVIYKLNLVTEYCLPKKRERLI
jgi:hypothetical protein